MCLHFFLVYVKTSQKLINHLPFFFFSNSYWLVFLINKKFQRINLIKSIVILRKKKNSIKHFKIFDTTKKILPTNSHLFSNFDQTALIKNKIYVYPRSHLLFEHTQICVECGLKKNRQAFDSSNFSDASRFVSLFDFYASIKKIYKKNSYTEAFVVRCSCILLFFQSVFTFDFFFFFTTIIHVCICISFNQKSFQRISNGISCRYFWYFFFSFFVTVKYYTQQLQKCYLIIHEAAFNSTS